MIKVAHLDRAGMVASTICAIHCAVVPLILGVLPVLGLGFVAHGWFEWSMVGLAFTVGSISLIRGHRIHRRHSALCFFVPGLVLLLVGLLAFGCDCTRLPRPLWGYDGVTGKAVIIRMLTPPVQFTWRPVIMALGGLTVATAHFVNSRLCMSCVKCEHG